MQAIDTPLPGLVLVRDILVTADQSDPPLNTAFPVTTGANEQPRVALTTPHIAFLAGDLIVVRAGFEVTNKLSVNCVTVARLGLAENLDDVPGRPGWTFIDKDGGGRPLFSGQHDPLQRTGRWFFSAPMSRRVSMSIKAYRSGAPGTENIVWEGTDVKLHVLLFRAP